MANEQASRNRTFPRRRRLHTSLTREQALEIFRFKVLKEQEGNFEINRDDRVSLATKFHVTEKTIRDIWNGRTWKHDTMKIGISFRANMPWKEGFRHSVVLCDPSCQLCSCEIETLMDPFDVDWQAVQKLLFEGCEDG
mmetsp:Transcript_3419/g.9785  ORF Transcript_3419/g.9785 Transcript_3419/m.9785 type:complete len:138 (+) Transcript_3419:56-469(+)